MTGPISRTLPYVVFSLNGGLFAISSRHVLAIITPPEVTGIPGVPPEIRGLINVRGKIVQLLDLRLKLGMPTRRAELEAMAQLLQEREQDHRHWLSELEACVRERRSFTLARDPHQCKFGRWYDAYRQQDTLLGMVLPSMDAPHQAIHALADEVLVRLERGDEPGALQLIKDRRNQELAALIKLFGEARRVLMEGCYEVVVVASVGNQLLAFTIDRVEATEYLPEDQMVSLPDELRSSLARSPWRVATQPSTKRTVLLIDETRLYLRGATERPAGDCFAQVRRTIPSPVGLPQPRADRAGLPAVPAQ